MVALFVFWASGFSLRRQTEQNSSEAFLVQQEHICMFTVKLTVDTHTHTHLHSNLGLERVCSVSDGVLGCFELECSSVAHSHLCGCFASVELYVPGRAGVCSCCMVCPLPAQHLTACSLDGSWAACACASNPPTLIVQSCAPLSALWCSHC